MEIGGYDVFKEWSANMDNTVFQYGFSCHRDVANTKYWLNYYPRWEYCALKNLSAGIRPCAILHCIYTYIMKYMPL